MWSEVNFGKWADKGKTLPQIIVTDPDWFFWALAEKAFKGALADQAQTLGRRGKAIKLPSALSIGHCIQYVIAHDGKFAGFHIIPVDRPPHVGSSSERRSATLDLSITRSFKRYDKLGAKLLLTTFKHHWFQGKPFSKARVAEFFENLDHFKNP